PYVTGVAVRAAGGVGTRMISYRDTGTTLRVTPRVTPEKAVALDLTLEDSRMHVPDDGVAIGTDENGAAVRATEFVRASLTAKLTVAAGQAVFAKGVKTESKSEQAQTWVVVTAHVVEPEKGGK